MSKIEEPKYHTESTHGNIEIRLYDPMLVAEVSVSGDRKQAINQGFRILADYIFGNNVAREDIDMTAPVTQRTQKKIPMTAPVIQQRNTKIRMTAPVTQQQRSKIPMTAPVTQQSNEDNWTIRFVMPSEYNIDTLPQPNDKRISIKTTPPQKFAVIRFKGMNTDKNIQSHEKTLKEYLRKNNIESLSAPIYAFYNPPWTLPFLRRNEVIIEISPKKNSLLTT